MNFAKCYRVKSSNVLISKVLNTFIEDGVKYTAYRMWAYHILRVNGQVVRKELIDYEDWCFGESTLGVEATFRRYNSRLNFDEIICKRKIEG